MSFRLKTIIGIALIEGLLLLLLIWMGLNLIHDSQEREMIKRADTVAMLFATTTKDAVLSSDLASLESFTEEVMKNPGLVYARVLDRENRVMVEHGDAAVLAQAFKPDTSVSEAEKMDGRFDGFANIVEAGEIYGQVQIGLNISELFELVETARSNATVLALLEMSLVAMFSFVLGTWLTLQIKALEHGAERISQGELGHQIPVKGNDELARTTRAFNTMSTQVRQLYEQLLAINAQLQRNIVERTSELDLLHTLPSLLENLETPLDEQFSAIVHTLKEKLPEADRMYVCIQFQRDRYASNECQINQQYLSSPIIVQGRELGAIEIGCLAGHDDCDFLQLDRDKQALLDTIAQNISTSIAHRHSLQERQQMEIKLRHAQKLESVGQLAAGIAHEINTPTQYVNDNMNFLKDAFADIMRLLEAYREHAREIQADSAGRPSLQDLEQLAQEIDLAFLAEETPVAIDQSLDGLRRISKIVLAMKEFSHPGSQEKTHADINHLIRTTLEVSHNEWKYDAELDLALDENLPAVPVLADEFNQVILNLIINAAHAIADPKRVSKEPGKIRIETGANQGQVRICVQDNGCGMSEVVRRRVFDPFFTTKDVGKGTGQGLAIAWSVIVDKHGGSLEVESTENEGSSFTILLPVDAPEQAPMSQNQ